MWPLHPQLREVVVASDLIHSLSDSHHRTGQPWGCFFLLPTWHFFRFAGQLGALLLSCAERSQAWWSLGPTCQSSNRLMQKFRRAVSESPDPKPERKPFLLLNNNNKKTWLCFFKIRTLPCRKLSILQIDLSTLVKFIPNIIYSSSLSSACWLIVPRTDHCDQMKNCQSLPLKNGFLFSLKLLLPGRFYWGIHEPFLREKLRCDLKVLSLHRLILTP